MEDGIQLNASVYLYADDPMDAVIIEWLNSLPRRKEKGETRGRVYRRGITRELRHALFDYAKKQNSRRVSDPKKNPVKVDSASQSIRSGGGSAESPGEATPGVAEPQAGGRGTFPRGVVGGTSSAAVGVPTSGDGAPPDPGGADPESPRVIF